MYMCRMLLCFVFGKYFAILFSERVLQDGDRPLEILQEWGVHQDQIKLILRYTILPVASQTGTSDVAITYNTKFSQFCTSHVTFYLFS